MEECLEAIDEEYNPCLQDNMIAWVYVYASNAPPLYQLGEPH